MKDISVATFLGDLGTDHGGMSQPIRILDDNGDEYILKNQQTPTDLWDCMFVQESLVWHIANHLGLLIPSYGRARVTQQVLDASPEIRFKYRLRPGIHFASMRMDGCENNLLDGYARLKQIGKPYLKSRWNAFFKGISNSNIIPGIVVLDLLTGNFDRFTNEGNLLVGPDSLGQRSIYLIDHGHCFNGPKWTPDKQKFLRMPSPTPDYPITYIQMLHSAAYLGGSALSGLGLVFRELEKYIDISDIAHNPFLPYVRKSALINEALLDSWFGPMPDEWFIERSSQIAYYKHFILQQRMYIPKILQLMASGRAFSNYIGGELNWNDTPTGTQ